MRHNDAHHNNSLVQICTQWNLDRNPFIYIPCVPEGTKRHCIAEVLPLFFCNADILDENSVMTSSGIPILTLKSCPVTTCWQTLGGTWLPLCADCMSGIVCWHLSNLLVGSWGTVPPCKAKSSLAVWGEHPCLCLYLSDLGRLSRELKLCHIIVRHVVQGRRAFRSAVLKRRAIALLCPRGEKI